jgi:hypothetical protein
MHIDRSSEGKSLIDRDFPTSPPGDLAALFDTGQFAAEVERLVAQGAPRVFAVVQEYGERVDARVAAWGFDFGDHSEVIPVDGAVQIRSEAPEAALGAFQAGRHVRARLVWVDAGHSSGGGAAP